MPRREIAERAARRKMMSWRYGLLAILLILSAIQRYIDPSKSTLGEIDMDLIFAGMMIVSAIEDLRR